MPTTTRTDWGDVAAAELAGNWQRFEGISSYRGYDFPDTANRMI